ncbi:MAG: hypothetical protein JSU86_19335 [Phycisphaerales bacterium]|nr:MAG: hypothetical protein JSU86_19335 [Phycisphaerales bacterium]
MSNQQELDNPTAKEKERAAWKLGLRFASRLALPSGRWIRPPRPAALGWMSKAGSKIDWVNDPDPVVPPCN